MDTIFRKCCAIKLSGPVLTNRENAAAKSAIKGPKIANKPQMDNIKIMGKKCAKIAQYRKINRRIYKLISREKTIDQIRFR